MPTDTKLNQLIINQLTQEQYDEAKAAGTLSDTELYITDSDDEALTNNKISNCITEIPQDIKLELNNGTLTLKAGSKVYVPNGFESDGTTKKFDIITIAEDKSYSWNYTGSGFVMVYINGNLTVSSTGSETVSSLTPAKTYKIFYNTTDNKCYFDESTTSLTQVSFPIARFTATDSITSIDQVFNGFGYIGSTVFALPGVKGLIPNGRNDNGSLKNIAFEISSVKTFENNLTGNFKAVTNGSGIIFLGDLTYHQDTNINTDYGIVRQYVELACMTLSSGVISNFTPKTVFHALDYNDSSRLESAINNKVNKSGDTMTGKLFFTNGNVACKNNAYAWNDTPATNIYYATSEFLDKNGERMGVWEFSKNKDGTNSMNVVIKNGTGEGWQAMRLYAKSDGSAWVTLPRSKVNGSACSTDSHGSNYVRFGNGLQICWFYPQISGSVSNYTLTLPVAFKDNNYLALIQQTGDSPSNEYTNTLSIMGKTTTNFAIKKVMVETMYLQVLCVGYWY